MSLISVLCWVKVRLVVITLCMSLVKEIPGI